MTREGEGERERRFHCGSKEQVMGRCVSPNGCDKNLWEPKISRRCDIPSENVTFSQYEAWSSKPHASCAAVLFHNPKPFLCYQKINRFLKLFFLLKIHYVASYWVVALLIDLSTRNGRNKVHCSMLKSNPYMGNWECGCGANQKAYSICKILCILHGPHCK